MNIFILLFSLLTTTFDASPQMAPISTVIEQPKSVLAFEHTYEKSKTISSFDSLAGVTLYSTEEELLETKGTPLTIVNDPWQNVLEYQYADVSVGVGEGYVQYVHISPSQAQQFGINISGVQIDPLKDNLKATLGTPYFIAEDGDVYMEGTHAIKVYRNLTGGFEGIDLFDSISS